MRWDVYDIDRVFPVNNADPTKEYSYVLDKPFFATAVRINPVSWTNPWPTKPLPQPACTMAEVFIMVPF